MLLAGRLRLPEPASSRGGRRSSRQKVWHLQPIAAVLGMQVIGAMPPAV